MAEDKDRLARFGASQGGLAAYNRWGAPVIRPIVQRGRDAVAYARIAGTKELADTMAQAAAKAVGQSADDIWLSGATAVADRFGLSAARGMVDRGFDGVIRHGTKGVLFETPAAGRTATYLSKLHRPPIFTVPSRIAHRIAETGLGKWIGKHVAPHIPSPQTTAVKALGSVSFGVTGGVVSGAAKRLAKQAFSKAGLTAGFATSGIMDGGEAIWDYVHSDTHITDIMDMKAGEWKKVRAAFLPRLGQGVLRGVDGALFGLPSFIPGYHDLAGGDDYMTGEYSRSGSARDNYKKALKLAGGPDNISAAEWAKISTRYEREKEDAYVNGIDEDGFAESGVTQAERERRRSEIEGKRALRSATAAWRKAMLYDFDSKVHPEGPDVDSLRQAVQTLSGKRSQVMGYIDRSYGDNDAFVSEFTEKTQSGRYLPKRGRGFRTVTGENLLDVLIRRGDTKGLTAFREKKRNSAVLEVDNETAREFSHLQKFQGFDALVDAVRQEASEVYHRVARTKGYTKDEAAQGFDDLWAGMSDFQKATLDTGRFAELLSADPAAGQEEPR